MSACSLVVKQAASNPTVQGFESLHAHFLGSNHARLVDTQVLGAHLSLVWRFVAYTVQPNQDQESPMKSHKLIFLCIRIQELEYESRLIRKQQNIAHGKERYGLLSELREHRVHKVRPALRLYYLAYAYLRGKAYHHVEPKAYKPIDRKTLLRHIRVFGEPRTTSEDLKSWLAPVQEVGTVRPLTPEKNDEEDQAIRPSN